jgi:hypothetical protein
VLTPFAFARLERELESGEKTKEEDGWDLYYSPLVQAFPRILAAVAREASQHAAPVLPP